MKTKNITHALLGLLLMQSCVTEFDLGDIEVTEKPVLYCIPAADSDLTIIQYSKSVSITSGQTPPPGIGGAAICVTVNGENQAVSWNEDATETLPAQCYYIERRLDPGDRISISAESAGLPAASSQTEIPEAFPLKRLELVRKPGNEPRLQFRITFQDRADADEFYGLRILCQAGDSIRAVEVDFDDEPLLNNKVGLDAGFDFDNSFYNLLYIWDDVQIAGKEYTLRVDSPFIEASDDGEQALYKVCLYRLSPDLYRFLKSLNDNTNNNLGEIGLAPLRSNYTNVRNGLGVVGGCHISESGWLSL